MPGHEDFVYLNGTYLPRGKACLSVEDRGTLFADGVYEVVRYVDGRSFAMQDHLDRLRRSLAGVRLAEPKIVADLPAISDELVGRNQLANAKVYWQITRGPGPRNPLLPTDPRPSVLAMTYPCPPLPDEPAAPIRAVLIEDVRWAHCWIKSLMLLPNVLARDEAIRAGAADAILHRQGVVTEATSANVMLVREGQIITPPTDGRILAGITRQHQLAVARSLNMAVHERAVTCDALFAADEIWLTSTTLEVQPVSHVNGRAIGDGGVGPLAGRVARAFARHVQSRLA
ncbi:MAG: aminotransferase class IV [Phycisphaeraceae bacterium]